MNFSQTLIPERKTDTGNIIQTQDGFTVEGPKVGIDLERPRVSDLPLRVKATFRAYIFDSLENDFFDSRYGLMGLYRPTALITHTQGFFFGLDEYDARKTQVLFIHGTGGTPRDWKFIMGSFCKGSYVS